MATLLALKRQAGDAARWRGHRPRAWRTTSVGVADTTCRRCGARVQVAVYPPDTGRDIDGPAVTVRCPGRLVPWFRGPS